MDETSYRDIRYQNERRENEFKMRNSSQQQRGLSRFTPNSLATVECDH